MFFWSAHSLFRLLPVLQPIASPPTSKAKSSTPEAELPDPRATPPPTELITPDVPASLDVQPSLIVEAPQTRQATPVPSEQHTYDVDEAEPQPLDLDEEVERILDADEEVGPKFHALLALSKR